jgi:hypothetical protein
MGDFKQAEATWKTICQEVGANAVRKNWYAVKNGNLERLIDLFTGEKLSLINQ